MASSWWSSASRWLLIVHERWRRWSADLSPPKSPVDSTPHRPPVCPQLYRYVGSTKSLSGHALGAAGVALVDVGRLGVPAGAQVASLRRMAEAHLGLTLHAGGRRHCAVEDAAVTMRLYHKLAAAEAAREGVPLLAESVDTSREADTLRT